MKANCFSWALIATDYIASPKGDKVQTRKEPNHVRNLLKSQFQLPPPSERNKI